jgi:8-oxo-dGTP pyrophosphatase MutT (NUDIX family)
MKVIKEIFRDPALNLAGRTLERASAKAIVQDGPKLLLIYSPGWDNYKFPGGGVEGAETDEQTLARELREECGARLLRIDGEFGAVVEYKRPFEAEYEVFKMISRYYRCQVAVEMGEPDLVDYERALGYRPVWIEIDTALQANLRRLGSTETSPLDWTQREAFVLGELKRLMCLGSPAQPAGDPPLT